MNGERTLDWNRKKNGSLLSGRRTIFERNIKTSGEKLIGTVIFYSLQSSLPEFLLRSISTELLRPPNLRTLRARTRLKSTPLVT